MPAKADKTVPMKAEATGKSLQVEYEGHTYDLDFSEMSIQMLEDWEDGKALSVVRALFGPEQWATFKQRNPGAEHWVPLQRAISAASQGNFGASSDS